MRGWLPVCVAALCLGCGSRVDLGGAPHDGTDAGAGGTGGTAEMDAGVAGTAGLDAGRAGNGGSDAGVAGSGGCPPAVFAQSTSAARYWGLALDADNVYWFSREYAGDQLTWIEKEPKTGGTPQRVGTVAGSAEWLVASGADVFFSGEGTGTSPGSVGRVTQSTGTTSTLVANVMARGVAANTTSVFYADVGAGDGLEMLPRAGGKVTSLSSIPPFSQSRLTGGPVVDGNDVYWINPSGPASLEHINPILATPPVTLATGALQGGVQALALSGGKLFYLEYNNSTAMNGTVDVKSVSAAGGQSTTLVPNTNATRVIADGGEVYFRNRGTYPSSDAGSNPGGPTGYNDDGSIQKVPATGGAPVTLVSGLKGEGGYGYVGAIAVDATYVYWVADDGIPNGFRIMRACR